jgi:hypothetical protein
MSADRAATERRITELLRENPDRDDLSPGEQALLELADEIAASQAATEETVNNPVGRFTITAALPPRAPQ